MLGFLDGAKQDVSLSLEERMENEKIINSLKKKAREESPEFNSLMSEDDYVSDLEEVSVNKKSNSVRIKIYEPTAPQKEFKKLETSGDHLITLLVVGRQVGKSYYALCDSIERCLSTENIRVLFVTPTYHLAAKHIYTVEQMFHGKEAAKRMVFSSIKYKAQELIFHNGSMIKFVSAEAGDALRGDTAHHIYVDEAAFIKESLFNQVILPMVTRTGGRFTLFTTPNGRNWIYKLFQQAQRECNTGTVRALRTDFRSLNDEAVNLVIGQMAKQMTKAEYQREVLALFVSDGAVFNNIEDCLYETGDDTGTGKGVDLSKLVPEETLKEDRFIGADIGVISDYTVLTCLSKSGWLIGFDRFNMREDELTADEFKDRIRAFYNKWDKENRLVAAYFEINNKELLFDEIDCSVFEGNRQFKWVPINTNGTTKPKMVSSLIKTFDEKDVHVPDFFVVTEELYAYTSRQNQETGIVKYGNDGAAHDDIVSSLVLADYCRKEEGSSGGTKVF